MSISSNRVLYKYFHYAQYREERAIRLAGSEFLI